MKFIYLHLPALLCIMFATAAEEAEWLVKHHQGAQKLSDVQDNLSADVQQITIEETSPQVIELLRKVGDAMDESSSRLLGNDTGGETLASQTEVIELIHQAVKAKQEERQQDSSDDDSGSALMDMLERMMGLDEEQKGSSQGQSQEGESEGQGEGAGSQGGQGQTGDSQTANDTVTGKSSGKIEERRVPKSSGIAGKTLPPEFQKALKAYNKALNSPQTTPQK